MQPTDLGHGRGWLDAPAAASVFRIDQQLGRPADINDAGRSAAQADENHRRWLAYKNGTGPWAPYALPSWASVHCDGLAADSDDWYNDAGTVWYRNGWRQTARYNDDRDEPWHGEYFPWHDLHINDRTNPTPEQIKENTMFIAVVNGNWHLVIPQGDTKPRAVLLGGESQAAQSGVPVFHFTDPNAVLGIKTAVEGIFG